MTTQGAPIRVLPGIPGMEGRTVDDSRVPYPESTQDFVKIARHMGYEVVFTEPKEDRRYVGFKALEDWLPVLEIARDLLIGIEGGLLVELLKSYLRPDDPEGTDVDEVLAAGASNPDATPQTLDGRRSAVLLHVDWRVTDGDHESRFRADGDADSVLAALARFEEDLRER